MLDGDVLWTVLVFCLCVSTLAILVYFFLLVDTIPHQVQGLYSEGERGFIVDSLLSVSTLASSSTSPCLWTPSPIRCRAYTGGGIVWRVLCLCVSTLASSSTSPCLCTPSLTR